VPETEDTETEILITSSLSNERKLLDLQGAAKKVPRRKLHFLRNGLIFQHEIFQDYLYGLCALHVKIFIKFRWYV